MSRLALLPFACIALPACGAARMPAPLVTCVLAAQRTSDEGSSAHAGRVRGSVLVTARFVPARAPLTPTPEPPGTRRRPALPGPRARDPRLAAWERAAIETAVAAYLGGGS